MINFKKDLLPYAGILFFLAFIFIYFSPMTDGYVLKQGDIDHFQGMAKEITDHRETYNEDPYWTDAMFGGMPAYQISAKYQESPLIYIVKGLRLGQYHAVMALFIAMIAMTICLRMFKVKPFLASMGGMLFALSSYHFHLLVAGHTSKMMAIALAPLLVAAIFYLLQQKDTIGRMKGILGVLIISYLEMWANHAQMTYYFLLFVGVVYLVALINAVKNGEVKSFGINTALVALAFVLGSLGNFNLYYKTYEYQKYSMRGGSELPKPGDTVNSNIKPGLDFDYITNWSYGVNESFSYLNPNVTGKGSGSYFSDEKFVQEAEGKPREVISKLYNGQLPQQEAQMIQYMASTYWGKQPSTMGTMYSGVILFFLAVLALVLWKNPLKWGVLVGSVLVLLLSWGHNFPTLTQFFIDHFPFYNKFRAVSSILVVLNFVIPFMGVIVLDRIIKEEEILVGEKGKKAILIIGGVFTLICLIGIFAPTIFSDFKSKTDEMIIAQSGGNLSENMQIMKNYVLETRKGDFTEKMYFSLFLVLLSTGLLYISHKFKSSPWLLGLILLGISFLDLTQRGYLYLNKETDQKGDYIQWKEKKLKNQPIEPSAADFSIFNQESRNNPNLISLFETEKKRIKTEEYNNEYSNKELTEVYNATQFKILNQNTHYRVAKVGDAFNDAYTSYYHKSSGGYHAAKLSHYQSLIDYQLAPEYQQLSSIANYVIQQYQTKGKVDSAANMAIQNALASLNVLNMLNTKYLILNPQIPAVLNTQALGHGWSAPVLQVVDGPKEEMDLMDQAGQGMTIIRKSELEKLNIKKFNGTANVVLNSYKSNELNYTVQVTNGDALTVFSEIYYPKEWKAFVDGEEVTIARVNYVLRALALGEGTHEVVFKFETDNTLGNVLVWLLNVIVLSILVFLGFRKYKNKNDSKA